MIYSVQINTTVTMVDAEGVTWERLVTGPQFQVDTADDPGVIYNRVRKWAQSVGLVTSSISIDIRHDTLNHRMNSLACDMGLISMNDDFDLPVTDDTFNAMRRWVGTEISAGDQV